jgi:TonB family protein
MSLNQASNAFDLLGLNEKPPVPQSVLESSHEGEPRLEVAWGDFHQGLWSSVRALVTPPFVSGKFLGAEYFRDCWVERRIPYRAVFAATLWHIVFFVLPFPQLRMTPGRNPAFDNTVLTWSGPIDDLPLLNIPGERPKPSLRGVANKPLPRAGADAFHPRQRIFTDPTHPTHPRQMLINSAAPPEPPKILPNLPNVVQLQQSAGPARPRIEISERTLAKLRPKERRVTTVTATPLPDIASASQTPAEITVQLSPNAPARPKLELNAGTAPRVAQRAQSGDVVSAPEVGSAQSASSSGNPSTFIALSATPGPPAPVVQPPAGNLLARIAISPEGKQPGSPGGSPNAPASNGGSGGAVDSRGGAGTGAGKNATAVSITGGNPAPKGGISGLGGGGKFGAPTPHSLSTRPAASADIDDPPARTGPPNFAALPPGAQPERIFSSKKVYRLLVNMPNLNSATGSWVLNFSELHVGSNGPRTASGELSGPEPLRKTDPKYPRTLAEERIEGEVILYAVIRKDGSVDSIQLVRGVDERLDAYAMQALGQWKFQPASRQGVPVDLEAIVHIPFHAPSNQ